MIHRNSSTREASSSSNAIRYLGWNSGVVVSPDDQSNDRLCSLQDIGGHIMKVPIIGFQILLCMRLEVQYVYAFSIAGGWMNNLVYWNVASTNKSVISYFRGHLPVLNIFHFQYFSLHFFYCKVLASCLLCLDWWRNLFYYYVLELTLDDIFRCLQKYVNALVTCTMAPGNAKHEVDSDKRWCWGME